ncbi:MULTISPECIES: sigma-54 dependent transcriptional regulator [unclassified Parabacteroides]|uniref:sigma-54-dependent transcriptional regulator n=1 Tax=unclassified Parabacteroides TaxID=2649774 RepID=UPI002474690D|nr:MULTISPECIES: sigma-54 dependent transcriptional regulator [unclassified Parabacteroides]
MASILILEDDITFALMLSTWLKKKDFVVNAVASISEAKQKIEADSYDLILSDLRLPDGDGIGLLKWMAEKNLSQPLIMMTSYAEIQTAVQAIKLGASDYISKPINPDELLLKIKEIIKLPSVQLPHKQPDETFVEGESPVSRQMFEYIRLVAPTDMSVLINGSSGTGKEYVARRIHELSNRKNAPFIAVDCGAIPKDLAASEFFGHVKGSFTGAIDNKTGAFEAAHGGTIFLDEIGNLTYEVQVQLLRALQERKVKPIGSNQEITTDVRLVSATNENLREAISKGEFREDLYHRINEFTIRIPDLKEREEDIMVFANHFLHQANQDLQKSIAGFDAEVIQLFQTHAWPGNLRQMKNAVKYATLLATGQYITIKELPEEMFASPTPVAEQTLLRDGAHERELILKALQDSRNNKTAAARLLGIDRKTLYNKLKGYGLDK